MPKPFAAPGPDSSNGKHAEREPRVNGSANEVVPAKKRRSYSASEKLRIVKAAEAAVASGERGALEALLRREGIYSSHLSSWRKQLASRGAAGLASQKPGRKPKLDDKDRQLLAATKELAVVKRKLLIANALIELQKKAHAVLGLALPELDEEL